MDENYIQLQEENGDTYEPTSEEINEEAKCLGIPLSDVNYLWIAREALKTPLPVNWIPYQHKKTKIIVYYNHKTGEVSQDHPMDAYYRSLYQKLKQDPSLLIQRDFKDFLPSSTNHAINTTNDLNTQLYLTSLQSYKSEESVKLCKEANQIAVEVSLFNRWLQDSISDLRNMKYELMEMERRVERVCSNQSNKDVNCIDLSRERE